MRSAKLPPDSFDPDAAATGLGLFGLNATPEGAGLVVIPVPFDATTSYRAGTARGPAAVLAASRQVDLLDREYGATWQAGIAMLPIPGRLAALSRSTRRVALPILKSGAVTPSDHAAARVWKAHARALAMVNGAGDAVNTWVRRQAVTARDEALWM